MSRENKQPRSRDDGWFELWWQVRVAFGDLPDVRVRVMDDWNNTTRVEAFDDRLVCRTYRSTCPSLPTYCGHDWSIDAGSLDRFVTPVQRYAAAVVHELRGGECAYTALQMRAHWDNLEDTGQAFSPFATLTRDAPRRVKSIQ